MSGSKTRFLDDRPLIAGSSGEKTSSCYILLYLAVSLYISQYLPYPPYPATSQRDTVKNLSKGRGQLLTGIGAEAD